MMSISSHHTLYRDRCLGSCWHGAKNVHTAPDDTMHRQDWTCWVQNKIKFLECINDGDLLTEFLKGNLRPFIFIGLHRLNYNVYIMCLCNISLGIFMGHPDMLFKIISEG